MITSEDLIKIEPKKILDTSEPKKITNATIEEKRTELEVLRLQKEIERLSKPDIPETNYFKEMLEQQKQHFQQMLEMNKQQNDIKLELERMKIVKDYEAPDESSGILEMLAPFLPQILQNLKGEGGNGSSSSPLTSPALTENKPLEVPQEMKGGESNMFSDKTNIKELEEYKAKIRSGEISETQAYKDFEEAVPPIVFKMTPYKKFKEEFDKIKNG